MGIEMTLKFEYLLQGISIEQPCGVDCSFSNDFHAIKKAKTCDDPLLDQGDWIAEPKQADWQFVNDKIIELLCEKTKRIGTPAVTTRGFGEAEVRDLAGWIADILDAKGDETVINAVKAKVETVCAKFPVYA